MQGFEFVHKMYPIYNLLKHMKGLVLYTKTFRAIMT